MTENLTLKKARQDYNINRAFWKADRKILDAKNEIQIFMNASERIKGMDIDKVSVEYLQEALQCILKKLNK